MPCLMHILSTETAACHMSNHREVIGRRFRGGYIPILQPLPAVVLQPIDRKELNLSLDLQATNVLGIATRVVEAPDGPKTRLSVDAGNTSVTNLQAPLGSCTGSPHVTWGIYSLTTMARFPFWPSISRSVCACELLE